MKVLLNKESVIIALCMLSFAITAMGQSTNATARIVTRKSLGEIPSASGIEYLHGKYYIIGDDSPWLFELNEKIETIRKIEVFDKDYSAEGRIPKVLKPDLEAITTIKWGKDVDLLLFGSGSGERRNILIRVDFDNEKAAVEKYDLEDFYKYLRKKGDISFESFNIEGAATWKDDIILLNRGGNHMFLFDKNDFKKYLKSGKKDEPKTKTYQYNLPSKEGSKAGFSGCCILKDENMLLFTASIENTPDWFNDGEIIGSYVGLIDLDEPENDTPVIFPVMENGILVKDKIESIINVEKSENVLKILVVTDNDNGQSELIEIELAK